MMRVLSAISMHSHIRQIMVGLLIAFHLLTGCATPPAGRLSSRSERTADRSSSPRIAASRPATPARSGQTAGTPADGTVIRGESEEITASGASRLSPISISSGKKRPVIDTLGWIWRIPDKLLLWDRRAANHKVSDETVGRVVTFLEQRELTDVHVRVNEYAPGDEWRRLRQNTHVGAGWRYTIGLLNWVGYTVFPGRIFGIDQYNPYSNTIYVYSDAAPLGLHEAAFAQDVRGRKYPGTYAAVQELPIINLWFRTNATERSLDYLAAEGDRDHLEEGYRLLYPKYGISVGHACSSIVAFGPLPVFPVAGAIVGHIAGGWEIRQLDAEQKKAKTADQKPHRSAAGRPG